MKNNYIKQVIGFDNLPLGAVKFNYPIVEMTGLHNSNPTIKKGGVHGGNYLNIESSNRNQRPIRYEIDPDIELWLGTHADRPTDPKKTNYAFGASFWLRIPSSYIDKFDAANFLNNLICVFDAGNINAMCVDISNKSIPKLAVSTKPYDSQRTTPENIYFHEIEFDTWIYISMQVTVKNGNMSYVSYSIDDIDVINDVAGNMSFTSGSYAFGFYPCSLMDFDSVVLRGATAGYADWPLGFDDNGAPITPEGNVLDKLPPIRIDTIRPTSNGSVNDWKSSKTGVPNFEAAKSSTDFVFGKEVGDTDLYKFTIPDNLALNNIQAIAISGNSDEYQDITPVMKDTDVAELATNKGKSSYVGIANNVGGEQLTKAKINAMEFGQRVTERK